MKIAGNNFPISTKHPAIPSEDFKLALTTIAKKVLGRFSHASECIYLRQLVTLADNRFNVPAPFIDTLFHFLRSSHEKNVPILLKKSIKKTQQALYITIKMYLEEGIDRVESYFYNDLRRNFPPELVFLQYFCIFPSKQHIKSHIKKHFCKYKTVLIKALENNAISISYTKYLGKDAYLTLVKWAKNILQDFICFKLFRALLLTPHHGDSIYQNKNMEMFCYVILKDISLHTLNMHKELVVEMLFSRACKFRLLKGLYFRDTFFY